MNWDCGDNDFCILLMLNSLFLTNMKILSRGVKTVVATIVYVSALVSTTWAAPDNTISWSATRPLKWSDFQGREAEHDFYAYTAYTITYKMSADGNTGKVETEVRCIFRKGDSWKTPDGKDDPEILKHEQLHFDIGELYARLIRKDISGYLATHAYSKRTDKDLKDIFQTRLDECRRYQRLYDEETDHSTRAVPQTQWNEKVARRLAALSDYAVE